MDGRAWGSGYKVSIDGGRTHTWVRSIREVAMSFNAGGRVISASTVYAIQAQLQRDDRAAGRPNNRTMTPLPTWARFHAVGNRGEREQRSQPLDVN